MRNYIFGSSGSVNDQLDATNLIRETLLGFGGDDTFTFYSTDFSDRFIGGAGDDLMKGLSLALGSYKDYSMLSYDGGAGYDSLQFDVSGSLSGAANSTLYLGRFQTLSQSVEHRIFDVAVTVGATATGEFSILGKAIDETVILDMSGSKITKTVVNVDLHQGNDRLEFTGEAGIHTVLKVNTGNGNDTVITNASTTSNPNVENSKILTGLGNDTVVLEGMHKETVKLGGGNDSVYILTGGFGDAPDKVWTGAGKDKIYMEIDPYSTVAHIKDFDAAKDKVVFDTASIHHTAVTFSAAEWSSSPDPVLYMKNATGELYFGDNVMAVFDNGATLTQDNFLTDDFLF